MSGAVDVLAVLRAARDSVPAEQLLDYCTAIAAVVELIEADAEFDRERDGYNPLFAKRDRLDRYQAAEARRAAALARCRGAA